MIDAAKVAMSSTTLTDLALKQMQQFDGTEFAASIEPHGPEVPEATPSEGVQMQQQSGVAATAAASRLTWHADIIREVELALHHLGVTNAEIAAFDPESPQTMYDAIRRAGGQSDVLRFIGSYHDTLSDEDVLDGLRHWNAVHEVTPPETEDR